MKDAAGVGRNERGDWRSSQANQPGPFERADAAWEVFKMRAAVQVHSHQDLLPKSFPQETGKHHHHSHHHHHKNKSAGEFQMKMIPPAILLLAPSLRSDDDEVDSGHE
ncbi:conserved hypothetical protein [Culex quinquefasciatus]|uniref:Uncharacterized protein n=1 Tax=Culex quinquefasciatus TaxID=7176 RepID=B0WQP7_CULQU|nr:conserved hypothetical protein [Culex quinquefasciatus]|eukprot:XP_001851031.1 conserved hypothetical protein [Culex quinquefasciatus]